MSAENESVILMCKQRICFAHSTYVLNILNIVCVSNSTTLKLVPLFRQGPYMMCFLLGT